MAPTVGFFTRVKPNPPIESLRRACGLGFRVVGGESRQNEGSSRKEASREGSDVSAITLCLTHWPKTQGNPS